MNDIDKCAIRNITNDQGIPTGGSVYGVGVKIDWQNGALGQEADRKEPNGAFIETVISAVIQRLQFFQDSKFNCRENAIALTHLETALLWLEKRTHDREKRGVEGEHNV